jgi:hypothetical protein
MALVKEKNEASARYFGSPNLTPWNKSHAPLGVAVGAADPEMAALAEGWAWFV